jgi:WD40 repeat protein
VCSLPTQLCFVYRYIFPTTKPVLCCEFLDGKHIAFAGCDFGVRVQAIESPFAHQTVSQHFAPVSHLHVMDHAVVLSLGWDKRLLMRDLRSKEAKQSVLIQYAHMPHAAAFQDSLITVGQADKKILTYDIRNTKTPVHDIKSPLELQMRSLALLPQQEGFAVGSIEGKIAIVRFHSSINDASYPSWLLPSSSASPSLDLPTSAAATTQGGSKKKKFTQQQQQQEPTGSFIFKAHWHHNQSTGQMNVYGVNHLCVNSQFGTLASIGADGTYAFWDIYGSRKLLTSSRILYPTGNAEKQEKTEPMPTTMQQTENPFALTAAAFASHHNIFAYALGNDYSKITKEKQKTQILMHLPTERELVCQSLVC